MAIEMPDTLETCPTDTATPATSTTRETPTRSRRAILTATLGALGGLFASRLGAPDPAAAAAGDPLIIGNTTNTAGTANTSLTTASTGTALLVTQNGVGTALRGSAVGAGSIAGFFTAANGTGISGVTGNPNSYGVFGSNDDAAAGTGGAIRADGNANHGLVATTDSASKMAVKASNAGPAGMGAAIDASGGNNVGVSGYSGPAVGVHGQSVSSYGVSGFSGSNYGVRGWSQSSGGVYGQSNNSNGVHGNALDGGTGVLGTANTGVGVYGYSTFGSAGYFEGFLHADSVSAAVKEFRIDHPLDPANKVLEHSCVESNERLTVYAGTVTTDADGEATVELPGYFEALNRDLRYQLTPLADARAWVKREVAGNRFALATSEPNTKVSWQVTGVRQDAYAKAHPLEVESRKTGREKGRYLNPLEHGQPERLGVGYELRQKARQAAEAAGTGS
jgi:hypothetical protein